MSLTAEELLAGSSLTHTVNIPDDLLSPEIRNEGDDRPLTVVLKPLTVKDIQLIAKGVKDNDVLTSAFMIRQSLLEPALSVEQISSMQGGLVKFLVEKINRISGLSTPKNDLAEMVQAPLAKACFILAREFGWTPEQVSEMTIGQILLYLEMTSQTK